MFIFVTEDSGKTQDSNTDTLIIHVLAPLMGVLILLILLVIAVIIPLISIIHLRMRYCTTMASSWGMLYKVFAFSYRRFSHNWQAYGNPELVCVFVICIVWKLISSYSGIEIQKLCTRDWELAHGALGKVQLAYVSSFFNYGDLQIHKQEQLQSCTNSVHLHKG